MAILNDTKIKGLKPKGTAYTLSDGEGLQLLIKPSGTKLWEFRYTSPTLKKRRKTSFGSYPDVKLKTARNKRAEYVDLISRDIDPIDFYHDIKEERKIDLEKQTHIIKKIVDGYLELKKNNKNLKDVTIKKAKSRLENHFFTYLPQKENTVIHNITFQKVIEILQKLESVNKLETLNRVRMLLIEIFKYAYTTDIIKDTELFGKLELYSFKVLNKDNVRNNPTLTDKDEIKDLYTSIIAYEHNLITKYAMLFTVHTAQRQGSIITAMWKDIDFDKKLWIIPADQMKMKKEHLLPLSDMIIKYLIELQGITGNSDYLFPNSQTRHTRNKYPHMSNNTVNQALRKMGYTKEQQTAHGFRAMFKTICKEHQEEHGLNNEFVERVLAHKIEVDVEASYNRANNIEDMRKVVNWWSEYLENAINKIQRA